MDKLAALVPELYYDLIGRFVPGAIGAALFAATLLALVPNSAATSDFLLTCLAVVLAYTTGLLLDVTSGLTIGPVTQLVHRSFKWLPFLRKGKARAFDHVEPWAFMRGEGDPRAGAVVGKLLAERTCLRSLAFLWLLLWLTGTAPVSALGARAHVFGITCLLFAQYRWEYLARQTAHGYAQSSGVAANARRR